MKALSDYEQSILNSNKIIVGIDEVGRGAIFGPVCVAAVALDKSFNLFNNTTEINDSKKLTAKNRIDIYNELSGLVAWDKAFEFPEHDLNSVFFLCAGKLVPFLLHVVNDIPDRLQEIHIITDQGLRQFFISLERVYGCTITEFIRGDSLHLSIALASVFAKVSRDDEIDNIIRDDKQYQRYDLHNNKGYTSPSHMAGIQAHGLTALHRKWYKNIVKYA